jgi:hypothetical protein
MNKSINLVLSVILLIPSFVIGQQKEITKTAEMTETIKEVKIDSAKHWDKGGLIGICFTQASFINWAAGGTNAMGLTSIASLHANYKNGKFTWLNDVELGYGLQKSGEITQKTTDQIELTSSVGYKIFDHVSLSFLTNFQTQFSKGYTNTADTTLLSDFMAPAFWVLAIGLQYSPHKSFHLFVSPAAARFTFVENQTLANEGAFGVDSGKRELTQFGAYLKANYSKDIMKNITLTTNLELFSNYLKDPQDIVINWTTFLQLKVNKLISATINTEVIYDNNIMIPKYKEVNEVNTIVGKGPRTQFKDVAGVSITYNL